MRKERSIFQGRVVTRKMDKKKPAMDVHSVPPVVKYRASSEIIIGMASMPEREASLREAVTVLAPQCDKMMVCLNNYATVPAWMDDYTNVQCYVTGAHSELRDMKAGGKMLWCGALDAYYLTCDDDIGYARDYVARMVDAIERYDRQAVVCVHGQIPNLWRTPLNLRLDMDWDRTTFAYYKALERDELCCIPGTGTAGWHTSRVRPLVDLPYSDCPHVDVRLAIYCQRERIPVVSIARPQNWLKFRREESKLGTAMFWDRDLRRVGYEAIAKWWPWTIHAPGNRRSEVGGQRSSEELVSFLIPAHNAQDWVGMAIESALNQTWGNIEVVVCDDASTDYTRQAMMEFAGDPRVRLIYSDDQRGLPATLNALMRAARGSIFARLDADDYSCPDRIKRQVHYMKENAVDACVCLGWAFKDDPGNRVACEYLDEVIHISEDRLNNVYQKGLFSKAIGPSLVWTRRLAEKVGWFDEGVPGGCDDHNYFMRIAQVARIGLLQQEWYCWRKHGGNMSRGKEKPALDWRRNRATTHPYGQSKNPPQIAQAGLGGISTRARGGSPVRGASRGNRFDSETRTGGRKCR